ncbi:MAG: transglutaminase family protein, partial [Muribaculaceae bacterium]
IPTFVNHGEYFSPQRIIRDMLPYDTEGALYKRYTAFEAPHIVRLDSLAHAIVGKETNAFKQSEMVYDYIVHRYPWAGAREYSTIPCIPKYVIEERHGDCGQVSLLYISLMRSLGVPARWESGWMLHPGDKNLHDWAEVYFEGVGWVPVDVSFGRFTPADDPAAVNFYSTGMDAHRLAANKGVCGQFYPPKKFVRSETVDAQMGEVECSRGNVFYTYWDQELEIIDIHPITLKK